MYTDPPDGVKELIWKMSPSDDRADKRGETPPGFAKAVFLANGRELRAAA
jgi:hypothetical protein